MATSSEFVTNWEEDSVPGREMPEFKSRMTMAGLLSYSTHHGS